MKVEKLLSSTIISIMLGCLHYIKIGEQLISKLNNYIRSNKTVFYLISIFFYLSIAALIYSVYFSYIKIEENIFLLIKTYRRKKFLLHSKLMEEDFIRHYDLVEKEPLKNHNFTPKEASIFPEVEVKFEFLGEFSIFPKAEMGFISLIEPLTENSSEIINKEISSVKKEILALKEEIVMRLILIASLFTIFVFLLINKGILFLRVIKKSKYLLLKKTFFFIALFIIIFLLLHFFTLVKIRGKFILLTNKENKEKILEEFLKQTKKDLDCFTASYKFFKDKYPYKRFFKSSHPELKNSLEAGSYNRPQDLMNSNLKSNPMYIPYNNAVDFYGGKIEDLISNIQKLVEIKELILQKKEIDKIISKISELKKHLSYLKKEVDRWMDGTPSGIDLNY